MKITCLLAVGLMCAGLASAQTPASAAKTASSAAVPLATGPSRVGIINIQEAIMSTGEGKKLYSQLQVRFQPTKAELDNSQKAITALQTQLNAGGNTMSQAAKDELSRQIAAKQRDLQQQATNAQSDYQNAQTDMMNQVGTKMVPILQSYAKQHGYTTIMDVSFPWPQGPVLYFSPSSVITAEIVKLYDSAHPVAASPKG